MLFPINAARRSSCATASGSYVTDFRYDSYTIEEGAPDLEELPHAHGENAETLDSLLKDRTRELWAHLVLTIFSDKDVLVKSFSVENGTDEPVRLTRANVHAARPAPRDYDLVHFRGRWGRSATTRRISSWTACRRSPPTWGAPRRRKIPSST